MRFGSNNAKDQKGTYLYHKKVGFIDNDADADLINSVIKKEHKGKGLGFRGLFKKEFTAAYENPLVTSWLEYDCPGILEHYISFLVTLKTYESCPNNAIVG